MHKNKINGKVYIGITCQQPEKRWQNGKHYEGCLHFNNAIQKYGWDNFEHIILKNDIQTEEEAIRLEKETIEKYKSLDSNFGYNMLEGGKGYCSGYKMTSSHKSNMLKSLQKFKESDKYESYIKKLREMGKQRWRNLTDEQKQEYLHKTRITKLNNKLKKMQQPICLITTHKKLKFLYVKKVFKNFYEAVEYDNSLTVEKILTMVNKANKLLKQNKDYNEIYNEKRCNWLFLKDACSIFIDLNPIIKIDNSQNVICKIYRSIKDINKAQRERILNLIVSQDICQKSYTWNYYLQWCTKDI